MTEKDRYDTLQKKTAGLDGIEIASGGLYSGEIPARRDALRHIPSNCHFSFTGHGALGILCGGIV